MLQSMATLMTENIYIETAASEKKIEKIVGGFVNLAVSRFTRRDIKRQGGWLQPRSASWSQMR